MSLTYVVLGATVLASLCAAGVAGDIKYGVASWSENLGNHRAVVRVTAKAEAVEVNIPWRRRDADPQNKDILVYDATTGKQVLNVAKIQINREFGTLRFQPDTAPGDYYVYYMPYTKDPTQWAWKVTYNTPSNMADAGWLAKYGAELKGAVKPTADVIEMQSRSDFHRFDPMELVATQDEVTDLLKRNPLKSFLLFPEDRRNPIKMTESLPKCWIESGPKSEFKGEAQRGEFYTLQVGVYAARAAIEDIAVTCTGLASPSGGTIPAQNIRCFNLLGRDWLGRPLSKVFKVETGKVGALWFGLQVPQAVLPGEYSGLLYIKPKGAPTVGVTLTLQVKDPVLADAGDSELWRMSRLRWLDSDIGIDDTVTAPYTPVIVKGTSVEVLGRSLRFGRFGLPESITSNGREILAAPMEFSVETSAGRLSINGKGGKVVEESPAELVRECSGGAGAFTAVCNSNTGFDGYTNFYIALTAKSNVDAKNMCLEIPIKRDVAVYIMGLGCKGGYRPSEWKWKWDPARPNNQIWIGDYNAGLQCKLKTTSESWDITGSVSVPGCWSNEDKGGCDLIENGDQVVIRAYTGSKSVKAGETLDFSFGLLITPVKPLNNAHFQQRYYHFYRDVPKIDEIAKTGANIVNIHQGNALNPNINYPFLAVDKLKAYVDEAHAKGMKAKIYYTVRELSNYVAEMWPLRSLGNEVFADGAGGGDAWLMEHLITNYSPAWHDPLPNGVVDAAIATSGLSRWHNYYLEGLSWLIKNVGIDGLYLDGIGYDRDIMKRVRRVMDQANPPLVPPLAGGEKGGCLIDFHSGNNFTYNDNRVSAANQYMEHFPYIDSVWFGEGYDYNEPPEYWFVEVSGIPFGLYGEMLQGGGNPWRGMLYGMTNRLGWGGAPRNIWKVWDDFGIKDSKMIGYWEPACPVRTDNKDILATAYVKKGTALISIASWAKEAVKVKLDMDWKALGIDPRKANLSAPAVGEFQNATEFQWSGVIPVEPGKGWLLVLKEN